MSQQHDCHRQSIGVAFLLVLSGLCFAQTDPGMRSGPPGAGQPLPGLSTVETGIFAEGLQRMIQLEAVCDDCSDLTVGTHVDPSRANRLYLRPLIVKNNAALVVSAGGRQIRKLIKNHVQPSEMISVTLREGDLAGLQEDARLELSIL